MVRAFINDLDESDYEFTDERLEQLISVAAKLVNMDLEKTYTINVTSPAITPDPVTELDEIFVNLLVLKSACMIDHGNMRVKAALAGLTAKAGPASISVGGEHFKALQTIVEQGPCKMYAEVLKDYKFGSGVIGHAIMGPFISNTFDPNNLSYFNSDYGTR